MKHSSIKSTFLRPVLGALLIPGLLSCGNLPRKTTTGSVSQSTPETLQRPATTAIRLNSATRAELERLPGIGRVLAERIVAHRNRYGPFRRVEHLMIVPGISERKFRELRLLIIAE
ncbi:MAG TPA: helix-hairpin-helix domain-containing protein [Acidobacteriota bacterium]|nr:helix-hairpin-helix domain-containing protein [Acidobacteriota bacterium]